MGGGILYGPARFFPLPGAVLVFLARDLSTEAATEDLAFGEAAFLGLVLFLGGIVISSTSDILFGAR